MFAPVFYRRSNLSIAGRNNPKLILIFLHLSYTRVIMENLHLFASKPIYIEQLRELCQSNNIQSFINKKDNDGNTPLHISSFYTDTFENMTILHKNGANINAQNSNNSTPLHCIIGLPGRMDMFLYLLDQPDLDINKKDADGETIFHTACRGGPQNLDKIDYLLNRFSDKINFLSKNNLGETFLYSAVKSNINVKKIEYLLKNVSKEIISQIINIPDKNNVDLLEYLLKNLCPCSNCLQMLYLLKNYGLDTNKKCCYHNRFIHNRFIN